VLVAEALWEKTKNGGDRKKRDEFGATHELIRRCLFLDVGVSEELGIKNLCLGARTTEEVRFGDEQCSGRGRGCVLPPNLLKGGRGKEAPRCYDVDRRKVWVFLVSPCEALERLRRFLPKTGRESMPRRGKGECKRREACDKPVLRLDISAKIKYCFG